MVTLHPSKPPLATIGRALTLVQVIFYLPLTLDVGGPDAFLALSASLATYYWSLSSLRLATKKARLAWLGDLFAAFQFLVVPACLAICWAVYCPPEKNYFFVRWARSATGTGNGTWRVSSNSTAPMSGPGAVVSAVASSASSLLSGGDAGTEAASPSPFANYHPATPPHLAAILQAITPIFKSRSHPYLEAIFDLLSAGILFLARKVPGWWGTLLRLSSPAFSLLEGSATLLVIQVLGTGCRYIIATSLTRPRNEPATPSPPPQHSENGKDSPASTSSSPLPRPRRTPLSLLSSIGIRGSEAWQLFFLLSSAIIYGVSGWALYLSFEGVAARGGAASLMMGISLASVAWLTAIAFAIGKGNVIETSLIFAYTAWNIFALSSASSLVFVSDPLALVRSFKGQVTSSYLDRLAPHLAQMVPESLQSFVAESLELVKVTFGQSWTFLGALASALPASVVVSLVYRLMVLYAASRILPFLLRPGAASRSRSSGHASQWSSSSTSSGRRSSSSSSSSSTSSRYPPRPAGRKTGGRDSPATPQGSPSLSSSSRLRAPPGSPGLASSASQPRGRSSSNSSSSSSGSSAGSSGLATSTTTSDFSTSYSSSSSAHGGSFSEDDDEVDTQQQHDGATVDADSLSKRKEWKDKVSAHSDGIEGGDSGEETFPRSKPSRAKRVGPNGSTSMASSHSSSSSSSSSSASPSGRGATGMHNTTSRRRHRHHHHQHTRHHRGDHSTDADAEPFGSFISFIVSYARLILIAVYSHLLLLDQSHQTIWRFSTVSVTLGLWTMELLLGGANDDLEFATSAWKGRA